MTNNWIELADIGIASKITLMTQPFEQLLKTTSIITISKNKLRKETLMSLKDFLKTDHVDLNKSPMFRQLIKNLKKEKAHANNHKH